jgi:hypothetical protein
VQDLGGVAAISGPDCSDSDAGRKGARREAQRFKWFGECGVHSVGHPNQCGMVRLSEEQRDEFVAAVAREKVIAAQR